jgi:hypothetical protein
LVTSVRGIGLLPMTAASSGLTFIAFMNAAFGFRFAAAFFTAFLAGAFFATFLAAAFLAGAFFAAFFTAFFAVVFFAAAFLAGFFAAAFLLPDFFMAAMEVSELGLFSGERGSRITALQCAPKCSRLPSDATRIFGAFQRETDTLAKRASANRGTGYREDRVTIARRRARDVVPHEDRHVDAAG